MAIAKRGRPSMVADTKRGYHEVARHGPPHGPTSNLATSLAMDLILYLASDAIPFFITVQLCGETDVMNYDNFDCT